MTTKWVSRNFARLGFAFAIVSLTAAAACNTENRLSVDPPEQPYTPPADSENMRDANGSWAPDGSFVLFQRADAVFADPPTKLMRYDFRTKSVTEIPQPIWVDQPRISPDGRRIAFNSKSQGVWQVWAMTVIGDSLLQLTSGEGYNLKHSWSPCGHQICYTQSGGAGRGLYILELETRARRLVSRFAGPGDWFPGCDSLAFSSFKFGDAGGDLAKVDTIGSADTSLASEEKLGECPCALFDLSVSPNGTQIALALACGSGLSLWIFEVPTRSFRCVTTTGGESPDWSPDGSKILFKRNEGGLWLINPDGSGLRPLIETPKE